MVTLIYSKLVNESMCSGRSEIKRAAAKHCSWEQGNPVKTKGCNQ